MKVLDEIRNMGNFLAGSSKNNGDKMEIQGLNIETQRRKCSCGKNAFFIYEQKSKEKSYLIIKCVECGNVYSKFFPALPLSAEMISEVSLREGDRFFLEWLRKEIEEQKETK